MIESELEYLSSSSSSSEEEFDFNISCQGTNDQGEVESICVPYHNEPLADTDESSDESDEHDEDGLAPSTLERRYNKADPVQSWCVLKMLFLSLTS